MSSGPSPPPPPRFPTLPIVTPEPARRGASERYGALFYLGVAGLAALVGLITWFGWGLWSLRAVWTHVYVVNDTRRSDTDRVRAADALARDPHVSQAQLAEVALNRSLPPLARYLAAEALDADASQVDPRAYGIMVARSEGWPDWLRLLMVRPLAYSAAVGRSVDRNALEELAARDDRALALWARYALAASGRDPRSESLLREAASAPDDPGPLARRLVAALDAPRAADRTAALDDATRWLRTGHPGAASVWAGWSVHEGRLVREPAPELHPGPPVSPRG